MFAIKFLTADPSQKSGYVFDGYGKNSTNGHESWIGCFNGVNLTSEPVLLFDDVQSAIDYLNKYNPQDYLFSNDERAYSYFINPVITTEDEYYDEMFEDKQSRCYEFLM